MSVSCGGHHAAVLDDRGQVWTMATNQLGQLGRMINGSKDIASSSLNTKIGVIDAIPQLVDWSLWTTLEKNSIHLTKTTVVYIDLLK
jgi:alpha-tubulin suppressor-like RCC1 family protein